MPEAQHTPDSSRQAVGPPPRSSRRHRRRPFLVRYWQILPVAALLLAAPLIWKGVSTPLFKSDPLPGYITGAVPVQEEYRQLTGKPLADSAALQQFEHATKLMLAGSYTNAVIVLEGASKQIPVPAVFNNLGVLYMKLNDGNHALRAFRDALARNHEYPAVRANLKLMHLTGATDPGDTELEPNDNIQDANAVWLDKPLNAGIRPADVDSFWFVTPRPPRDRISIQVMNRSNTLIPHMRVYDADGKMLGGLREASEPGGSLRFDFSPPPNSFFSIQVNGASGSYGDYTLAVNSLRAYDVYEPNDDILNATRIVPGQPIEANIMDATDTDFYSFESPAAGPVTIDIAPHGATAHDGTLVAGLSTFASDLRNLGFGPDLEHPGEPLHYVMNVEANQVYYLQVFGKTDTVGDYTLTVK